MRRSSFLAAVTRTYLDRPLLFAAAQFISYECASCCCTVVEPDCAVVVDPVPVCDSKLGHSLRTLIAPLPVSVLAHSHIPTSFIVNGSDSTIESQYVPCARDSGIPD
jgi:hypothetical protein